MPYNFTTSFKMWAIYHSKPFASAAGNYEGHLSMLLKKKGELNIKCNECSDYIADAESYLARRERKKSYLQIEQTHVTSGTPRAKTISLEITVANRTIRKFQKRAEKARQVRVKGEQYKARVDRQGEKVMHNETKREEKLEAMIEKQRVKMDIKLDKERAKLHNA